VSDERWTRIKTLFHAALDRAPGERQAFLAEACGTEEELRAEVDRLLAAHADAGDFIERSPAVVEAARSSPALTGRVLGHYEVGQLLGVGGVGEVYAARDIELKRRVALKVVPGADWQEQLELRQEAQLASQLNHPHICTIHEVGTAEGQTYFVMEYVDGEPLSDAIAKGKLATADAVRYGIQIADAVAHAHRHGVIHGDLKSANVVLTADGHAKVLDFGLARQMSSEQVHELSQSRESWTEGPAAGTLPYMAPELLRGERADRLTDSMGAWRGAV
jgi:serine/threonine-protein kinase